MIFLHDTLQQNYWVVMCTNLVRAFSPNQSPFVKLRTKTASWLEVLLFVIFTWNKWWVVKLETCLYELEPHVKCKRWATQCPNPMMAQVQTNTNAVIIHMPTFFIVIRGFTNQYFQIFVHICIAEFVLNMQVSQCRISIAVAVSFTLFSEQIKWPSLYMLKERSRFKRF